MGAGKTTLGKAFAREMNVPFIDLEWYIEERFHKSIRELFTERGDASFRELERNMLHEVGEFEDVVVSTGGGTPVSYTHLDVYKRQMQKSGRWDIAYICDTDPASRELARNLSPSSRIISDEQEIFDDQSVEAVGPVSYTHLDVYKRQIMT